MSTQADDYSVGLTPLCPALKFTGFTDTWRHLCAAHYGRARLAGRLQWPTAAALSRPPAVYRAR